MIGYGRSFFLFTMKTHLPKAILAAIMAIPSLAVAEVNNNWTWANKTETDPITCSGLNYQMAPSAIVEVTAGEVATYTNDNIPSAWKNASTVTDSYGSHVQPFLKDGDGTLKISGIKGAEGESVSIGSPLYVREGTATITGCNIIAGAAFTTSQLMLGVSGKNANLELIDTTYANDGDISTKYIGVGGPDGSGTLTLSGNTTVTAWTMFAGRSRTNAYYRVVTSTTDTTAANSGRYADGVYTDTGLFYGTDNNGDGVGDTPRIYGKATVNVNTGSEMHLWNQIDASEAEINVNGGTIQADNGIILGRLNGSSSELNITNGGKVITTNSGLYTGGQLTTSPPITQYDTTVTVSGEGSELNVTGVKLGYTTANDTADRKSQTTLKVTDGATVTAGYISLGRAVGSTDDAGKVQVEVGAGASLKANSSISLLCGTDANNDGTMTAAEMTIETGAQLTTSGSISLTDALTLNGGELEIVINDLGDLPSLTIGSLEVNGGTIELIFGSIELLNEALGIDSTAAVALASLEQNVVELNGLNNIITFTEQGAYEAAVGTTVILSYKNGDAVNTYSDVTNIGYVSTSVPEPTTATLSLLALAGLCARRRRK